MTACAVAAGVLEAIAAHARRDAPHECCGLLLGTESRIDEAIPVENRAAEPARRYEIDPREILAVMKRTRGTPRAVVGAYHSHPKSAARPSPTDLAEAFSHFLYLIAGPVDAGARLEINAWRLTDGNFDPVRLVPDHQELHR